MSPPNVPVAPEGAPACPRMPDAGAYLLGALNPAERADYAAHLETCPHCLREVGQLAGLPGLLARRAPAIGPEAIGPASGGSRSGGSRSGGPVPGGGPSFGGPVSGGPVSGGPVPGGGPSFGGPVSGGPVGEPTDPPTGPVAVPHPPPGSPPPGLRPVPAGDPPPDPVAGALREVYRVRRRRRTLVAAGFVLLAGLAVAGPVAANTARSSTGVTAAADLPVPMQPVGNVPVSAAVALTERPWGTEVVMRCRYAGVPQSPVYVLVARAADGTTSELARWSGVADQDVVLATATELPSPRLAELEVRNAAGTVLLRADRPS